MWGHVIGLQLVSMASGAVLFYLMLWCPRPRRSTPRSHSCTLHPPALPRHSRYLVAAGAILLPPTALCLVLAYHLWSESNAVVFTGDVWRDRELLVEVRDCPP